MPYPLSKLLEGRDEPVTVIPSDLASSALSTMGLHDFSQLPVVDNTSKLVGLITVESILTAIVRYQKMPTEFSVQDCMHFKPRVRSEEDDLAAALADIEQSGVVIVTDQQNRVKGIITDFDTASYFRAKAEDILLIEDIETTLRSLVMLAFQSPDGTQDENSLARAVVQAVSPEQNQDQFRSAICNYLQESDGQLPPNEAGLESAYAVFAEVKNPDRGVSDLTFAEISKMWIAEDRWPRYSGQISLERASVFKRLDEIRVIRNKVFHFRGDVSREESKTLENCRDWLQYHYQKLLPSFMGEERIIEEIIADQNIAIEEAIAKERASRDILISEIEKELQAKVAEAEKAKSEAKALMELAITDKDDDMSMSMPVSKYAALGRWLEGIPNNVSTTWIGFPKLEELIDATLPRSAFIHRSWWANNYDGHSQATLWLKAGWETDIVDFERERVRFRRMSD